MPDPRQAQLDALRREHAEIEASLPQHSVPASMLIRLEDLEAQIAALQAALAADEGEAGDLDELGRTPPSR